MQPFCNRNGFNKGRGRSECGNPSRWRSPVSHRADSSTARMIPKRATQTRPRLQAVRKKLNGDQEILHALDRLTFGPRPGDVAAVKKMGLKKWIDLQLHPRSIPEEPDLSRRNLHRWNRCHESRRDSRRISHAASGSRSRAGAVNLSCGSVSARRRGKQVRKAKSQARWPRPPKR